MIQLKLCFTEIVGDGNCFYRSLSFYLFGHQNEHSTIRENVILYMSGGGGQTEAEKEERSRRYGRLMQNRRQSYEDYLRYFIIISKLNEILKSCDYFTNGCELWEIKIKFWCSRFYILWDSWYKLLYINRIVEFSICIK